MTVVMGFCAWPGPACGVPRQGVPGVGKGAVNSRVAIYIHNDQNASSSWAVIPSHLEDALLLLEQILLKARQLFEFNLTV